MIIQGDKSIVKKLIHNSKQKLIPLKVFFELTYNCNLKCKHCIVSEDKNRQELTDEQICSIIDQIAEFGCMYINFTGGEPLIKKDFLEIFKYTKKKGLAFTIQTNGTLITPEIADKIAALSPLQVSITLLGSNKNTHNEIVGSESAYERTVEAIRLLRERKVHVYIVTVIMRQNVSELPRIENFAQQVGASWAICAQIIPKFDGSEGPILCRALSEQLKKSINRYSQVEIREDRRSEALNTPLCDAGGSSTTVTAYGDLNPCPAWMRNKERNLLKGKTLFQIWQEDADFRRIRDLRKSDLLVCRDCNLLLYCSLCPVLNFFEKGDIMLPASESCRRARAKKEALEERGMQNGKKIK